MSEFSTVTYTVNPKPTAIAQTPTVCSNAAEGNTATVDLTANNSAIDGAHGYTITWYSNALLTVAIATPASYLVTSGVAVYAKVVNGSCQNSASVTYTVSPKPTAIAQTPAVCSDAVEGNTATVDLTANNSAIDGAHGYTITWYSNALLTTAIATPTSYLVTSGVAVYAKVVNGTCQNSASVTYTVSPKPTAIAQTPAVCSDAAEGNTATVNLTTNNNAIDGPYTYTITWYSNALLTTAIATPTSYLVTSGVAVYAKVVNGSCQNSTSVTYTVSPKPTAIAQTPTVCSNAAEGNTATVDLTSNNSAIDGAHGYTITWYSNALLTTAIATPTSYLVTSGVAVYVKVVNGSCQNSTSVTYTVSPKPTAIAQTPIVCSDAAAGTTATVDLTANNNAIDGPYTYTITWYSDALLTTAIATPTSYVVTNGVPVYAKVVNGTCQNSAAVTYTVVSNPDTPELTGITTVCGPGLTAYLYRIGDGTYFNSGNEYHWTIPGDAVKVLGGGLSDNFIMLSFPSNVPYILKVKENTLLPIACYGAEKSLTINVYTNPVPNAGSNVTICQGGTTTLGGTPNGTGASATAGTGNYIYSWLPTYGLDNPASEHPVANPAFTLTYQLVVTDAVSMCASTAPSAVTVTVTPSVTISPFSPAVSTRCQGSGTITYATTAANNSSAIVYTLDAASLSGGNTIDGATGAVTFDAAWVGTTTITATVNGCSGGAPGSVTTNHVVTTTPTVTIDPFSPATSTRCQGAGIAIYTTTGTNTTGITYSLDATTAAFPGNSIVPVTGVVTYAAGWSGVTTITASAAGCNGPALSTHIVTITPTVTINAFSPAVSTRCQGAETVIYTTTGNNIISITYSIDGASIAGGNTIDGATGTVTYAAGWSGTTTITASAAGCNGPATTTHIVTVNPSTGATSFISGATTVCQNAANETYVATAANSTSVSYSVLPVTAGVINAGTGIMDWDAAFSGTATITATATGLCGTTSADRDVTVNPSTGPTTFTAGAVTLCQDAGDETYTATALNSTSIAYSVSPSSAGTIDPVSGVMNWDAAFFGPATITATSTGLCGTTSANRLVTVNATIGATAFTAGATTVCQDAADETYTATAAHSTSVSYSVLPAAAGVINAATGVMNWDAAFSGTATITALSTGLCGTSTADRIVTVNPSTGPTSFTGGAVTICQDAIDETYTAMAANSTSIAFSVLPAAAGIINVSTGVMNWDAGFSGAATITATATGLCGTTSATRVVTINPSTGPTTFTAGPVTVCQDAANATYTATALHSTSIAYSVSPGSSRNNRCGIRSHGLGCSLLRNSNYNSYLNRSLYHYKRRQSCDS